MNIEEAVAKTIPDVRAICIGLWFFSMLFAKVSMGENNFIESEEQCSQLSDFWESIQFFNDAHILNGKGILQLL
jgi:hypothetical protein